MLTIIVYSIATLLFGTYLTASIKELGLPKSLSDTFYDWEHKDGREYGMLFTVFMAVFGTLIATVLYQSHTGFSAIMGLLAGLGLTIVSIAPHFHSYQKPIHMFGAFVAAVTGTIMTLLDGYWYVSLPALAIAQFIAWINPYSKVFWMEMGAFFGIIAAEWFKLVSK